MAILVALGHRGTLAAVDSSLGENRSAVLLGEDKDHACAHLGSRCAGCGRAEKGGATIAPRDQVHQSEWLASLDAYSGRSGGAGRYASTKIPLGTRTICVSSPTNRFFHR